MQPAQTSPVRGRKMRFTWNDGPTQGKTCEHVFHENWYPVHGSFEVID